MSVETTNVLEVEINLVSYQSKCVRVSAEKHRF